MPKEVFVINWTKPCSVCGKILPIDKFYRHKSMKCGYSCHCKKCDDNYSWKHKKRKTNLRRERNHKKGINKPLNENRDCPVFLGVYIAENILSKYFKNIKKMPYGNKGYDFICKNGFKIDVKSSTVRPTGYCNFQIMKNKIADYFLCLSFDNRKSLNPLKVWLIPGSFINSYFGISIKMEQCKKYEQYEKPLDKVMDACNLMKATGVV